jgi:hypothetical protein
MLPASLHGVRLPSPLPIVSSVSLVSLASLTAITGCGERPNHVRAPIDLRAAAGPVAAPGPRTLVWTTGPGGARQTWTVDETGAVTARVDEVRVAAGGKVWAWRETPRSVETTACARYDEDGSGTSSSGAADPQPPPGSGVRAALERVDPAGGGELVEVIAAASDDGAQEIDQRIELVATVGPYFFVRDSTYAYTCGAHGNVGVAFALWDAERQADVGVGIVDGPMVSEAQAHASSVFAADDDVSAFAEDGELEVDLTAIVPSYDREGRLVVGMQFTAPSCYACSDGAWSSYSKSTTLAAPVVPDALRTWATAPTGVRGFAHAHPGLAIGGWSDLPQDRASAGK